MSIYIVSGYMRSGTSMMMRALMAGGLEACYDIKRDQLNQRYGDSEYQPNAAGLYELNKSEYNSPGFPDPAKYDGKLIKTLFSGTIRCVAGDYRIVFMLRDIEEIRQSCVAFFGNEPGAIDMVAKRRDNAIGILKQRRDVELIVLNYREVVDHPLHHFRFLRELGWPIDPVEAAAIVDPEQCRYRLENLEVGIS